MYIGLFSDLYDFSQICVARYFSQIDNSRYESRYTSESHYKSESLLLMYTGLLRVYIELFSGFTRGTSHVAHLSDEAHLGGVGGHISLIQQESVLEVIESRHTSE